MVKPHERNTRYVDAVMTIPKARLLINADINYSPVHLQNSTAENNKTGPKKGLVAFLGCNT